MNEQVNDHLAPNVRFIREEFPSPLARSTGTGPDRSRPPTDQSRGTHDLQRPNFPNPARLSQKKKKVFSFECLLLVR